MHVMPMSDIHENAKRCIELHGDKAEIVAREKAEECERNGKEADAQSWHRIRAALLLISSSLSREIEALSRKGPTRVRRSSATCPKQPNSRPRSRASERT